MRKAFLINCCLVALGVSACGKKAESSPGLTNTEDRVFFLTSDYASNASYLHSFNTATGVTTREAPSFFSNDVIGFQDRDREHFYIGERFSALGLPTRLTHYEPNGSVQQNSTDVPVNLHDAILFDNKLYFAGYDRKELAVSTLDLSHFDLGRSTVNGFSPMGADPMSFEKFLVANNKIYLITVGYHYAPEAFVGAKLFELADDLVTSSPVRTWSIQAGGEECWDLYTAFRLSADRMVVACNPYYANNGRALSVFSIDMSNGVGPVITLLNRYPMGGRVKNVTLGGASKNAQMIFITEDDGNYLNPMALQAAWWDMTGVRSPFVTQGAAFFVEYNQASNQYVYSCSTEADKRCATQSFTVSQADALGAPSETGQRVNASYVAGHVQFFHEL